MPQEIEAQEWNWMSWYATVAWSSLRFAKDYAVGLGSYLLASKGHKAMTSLTSLESIAKLSPRVIRVLGQNPGPFTLQGTNTYIVGTGSRRVLIDTGEPNTEKYISELQDALENATIEYIVITHWHNDHVGGLPNVLADVVREKIPVFKVKRVNNEEDASQFEYVQDGHEIKVEGATLKFVQTPGHTIDHAALWLAEENALFSGDCILGEGTTVFEDLHAYMNSLNKIKDLKPERIYPGHGPVIENTTAKIEEYIAHRVKREEEILKVLREHDIISSMDITNIVYKDSPLSVRLAALNNVKLVLNKLITDRVVERSGFEMYKLVTKDVKSKQ